MTIRFTCHSCGSKLNIKDELAGTAGKCPKCKTDFTVPQAAAGSEGDRGASQPAGGADASSEKARVPAKAKMPARASAGKPGRDEDFDPVAFLMEEEKAAARRSSASPLSDDEIPAALELDISEDEPPRRRSRARRRVNLEAEEDLSFGSASATAGAMLSGGASAGAARDLLTRTVEESRARAARLDDDQTREPSAALEMARDIVVRILPGLLGIAILGYGLYWISDAVIGGGIDLPDLGRVSGTITLDGAPFSGAKVRFQPVESEFAVSDRKSIQTRTSTGITDENGYYELNYMEDVSGAVVGEHRVSISKRDGPRELAPSQFGPYSVERRTVESGSNTIDFTLESDRQR